MSHDAIAPATAPIAALTTTIDRNDSTASGTEVGLVAAPTAMVKMTIPVPSLRRLSASTNVARRRGARNRLKLAMTAAGSVADTIAPTTKPAAGGTPAATDRTTATPTATTTTPGPASSATPASDGRSTAASML